MARAALKRYKILSCTFCLSCPPIFPGKSLIFHVLILYIYKIQDRMLLAGEKKIIDIVIRFSVCRATIRAVTCTLSHFYAKYLFLKEISGKIRYKIDKIGAVSCTFFERGA